MAVDANIVSTRLQLKLNTGTDENGKDIISTKTYSNVKPDANDQGIYDVGNTLSQLQNHLLQEIHRIDDVVIMEV